MEPDKQVTELEWFAAWAATCGHYPVVDLLANFRKYQASLALKRKEEKPDE